MQTIKERADRAIYNPTDRHPLRLYEAIAFARGYELGATEQKAIDEKYIKLLEEDRNAFIAFCYNIINGKYISVIDAAKEQLSYLENKVMEE